MPVLFPSNLQGYEVILGLGRTIILNVTLYMNNCKLYNQFLILCKACSIAKILTKWVELTNLSLRSNQNWNKSIAKTNFYGRSLNSMAIPPWLRSKNLFWYKFGTFWPPKLNHIPWVHKKLLFEYVQFIVMKRFVCYLL